MRKRFEPADKLKAEEAMPIAGRITKEEAMAKKRFEVKIKGIHPATVDTYKEAVALMKKGLISRSAEVASKVRIIYERSGKRTEGYLINEHHSILVSAEIIEAEPKTETPKRSTEMTATKETTPRSTSRAANKTDKEAIAKAEEVKLTRAAVRKARRAAGKAEANKAPVKATRAEKRAAQKAEKAAAEKKAARGTRGAEKTTPEAKPDLASIVVKFVKKGNFTRAEVVDALCDVGNASEKSNEHYARRILRAFVVYGAIKEVNGVYKKVRS